MTKSKHEDEEHRPQNGQLELRMTAISSDVYHVRVRVVSRIGGQLATNGFITFNREEWDLIAAGDYHVTIRDDLSPINREREALWE